MDAAVGNDTADRATAGCAATSDAGTALVAAPASGAAAAKQAAPLYIPLDQLAEQTEVAEEMAANADRMGSVVHLHCTLVFAILTDLQRAQLWTRAFPVPVNAGKCERALQHLMKFRHEAFPPAVPRELEMQQGAWLLCQRDEEDKERHGRQQQSEAGAGL